MSWIFLYPRSLSGVQQSFHQLPKFCGHLFPTVALYITSNLSCTSHATIPRCIVQGNDRVVKWTWLAPWNTAFLETSSTIRQLFKIHCISWNSKAHYHVKRPHTCYLSWTMRIQSTYSNFIFKIYFNIILVHIFLLRRLFSFAQVLCRALHTFLFLRKINCTTQQQ